MSQIRSTPSRMPCRALRGAVFCALVGALLPGAAYAGVPPFMGNNGTVKHTIALQPTGTEILTWQQCQIGRSDAGCADDGSGSGYNWYEAWAEAFAANPEGDVKEWRLPSQHELYRLYFDGVWQQAGDPFDAAEFPNTSGYVWSSSPRANFPNSAWRVSFNDGDAYYDFRGDNRGVRLVRAGQCFGALAPLARPATPTVTVTPNGTNLEFTWAAPTDAGKAVPWSETGINSPNGHSTEAANGLGGGCASNLTTAAIEAYAYSTNGGTSWTVKDVMDASATSATILDAASTDFDFRLTAINTGGLWSEMLRVNQNGTFHNTSTFEGPTGSGTARAEIVNFDNTSCRFDINKTKFINATGTPQANVYFPHGLLDFTLINCSTTSETAEIKITWPSSLAGGTYWKDKTSISAGWEKFTAGCTDDGCAAINGNEVTIYVQDGGAFDLDNTAGTIRDPSGIVLLKVGTGGTPIPALPAPLIALTGLLAALAGWRLHRAKAGSPQA